MNTRGTNGDFIRRYLLGDLSEEEREHVERRLMSDDDLYQQLLLAEDELVDEYVTGTLPEQDRAKFGHFLRSPELQQDVRFTVALRKHALKSAPRAAAEPAPKAPRASRTDWLRKFFMQPALGVSLATALLVAVLVAAWLATQNSQLRRQVGQLRAQQSPPSAPPQVLQEQLASERLRNEQLTAQLRREQESSSAPTRTVETPQEKPPPRAPAPKPPRQPQSFVAVALTPGAFIRESGAWEKITLLPGVREVRVRLDLPEGGYRSYRAALKTVDGREVLENRRLRDVGGKFVRLNIPAQLLGPDDYQITLSGMTRSGESEEIGTYYFRVLR